MLCAPACKRWAFNALIAPKISVAFMDSGIMNLSCESVKDLSDTFNLTCTDILDSRIAPLRAVRTKLLSEPWLNEHTCTLRCDYRRAVRRWKKDRLCFFTDS